MVANASYKETDVGVIPEDWEVKPLSGLCEIKGRVGWKGYTKKDLRSAGPLAIGAKHIDSQNRLDLSDPTHLSVEKFAESPEIVVEQDDILIVQRGSLGRVVLIDRPIGDATINPSMVIIRVRRAIPGYLFYQLTSAGGQRQILVDASSTGVPMISQKQIGGFEFPLAPTALEQHHIATALSDVDALLGALDRIITKKRDLKQAAMQQLLTGQTRLPGFSGKWVTKRLGELSRIRNDKVLPKQVDPVTACVELEHVGQGDGRLHSIATANGSTSSKYRFRTGDVLFGRLRPYLRKFWLADRDGICTTEIWPLTVDAQLAFNGFLHAVVQTPEFVETASISYGTHMPRADWGIVKNFPVSLPPRQEQRAVANVLADMSADLTALEQRRDKTRLLKQGMMQELLTGRTRLV